MHSLVRSIRRFLSELRRRNVYQVAVTYVIVGFFVIEGADLVLTRLGLPPWTVTFVIVLVGLGFPIALVLAWALEMTPEGVRVEETETEESDGAGEIPASVSPTQDLWVGASVLALLLLGMWWIWGSLFGNGLQNRVTAAATDSTRVVVFPFATRGGKEISYLGEGMVELLGRSIDGAGPLTAVDPKAVVARVGKTSTSGLSPDSARRIAARLGAGRFVLGSVLKIGEELRVSGTWYRTGGGELGSAEVTGQGEQDVPKMVDELARSAIADLTGGGVERRQRVAAQTTSSAEALKAYLEGQEAFRAFNYPAAAEAYSKAIEEDSTFALAYYRLSLAIGWVGKLRRAHRAARRAAELSEGLPSQDRRLLRANDAFFSGEAKRAERLYRTVLQNHPRDPWAWYMLGETLFHFNGSRGRSVVEAREPLRRAMHLDPNFTEPFGHLVHLALLEGDTARVDSLMSQLENRRIAPTLEDLMLTIRAYVLNSGPGPALRKRLSKSDSFGSWWAGWILSLTGRLDAASELIRPFASPDHPDEMRAAALTWQADLLAARGQLQAARRKAQAIAPLDSAAYWMVRSRLAALPFLPEADGQSAVRRGLSRWNARAVPKRLLPSHYLLPRELYPAGRLYRLGLLRARSGNLQGALRMARKLDTTEATLLAQSAPADFAHSIRAEVNRREGRIKEALDHLKSRQNRVDQALVLFRLHSGTRERFVRAELLAKKGRLKEALRWYRTVNGIALGELAYLAPTHLGRARALEKLGRPGEAAEAYRRVLDLWAQADPVLQPKVSKVRQRMAALEKKTEAASATSKRNE